MGIAQLLYYRPSFAILDDSTSALPAHEEARLLEACVEAEITLISTTEKPLLQGRLFSHALNLSGDGDWNVELLEES